MADDGTIDTPSPQDVLAAQQGQVQQGIGSPSAFQRNSALGTMLGRTLFGNPQLQQANAIQNGLKAGASGVGSQQGGESDVEYTLRKLKAQRDAVADVSPQLAAQLNTQILTLGQKKMEQSRLNAEATRAQATFDAGANKRTVDSANAVAQNKTYVVASDPGSPQGYKVQSFDMTNPAETAAYQDASTAPGATTVSAAKAAELFTKSDVQSQKFQLAMAKAQATAGQQLDDGALKQLTAESIFDTSAQTRLTGAQRVQIASMKRQYDISPVDEASARSEVAALKAGARVIGTKEANVAIFGNSLKGYGNQVLDTLNGVDRGSLTGINSLVASGKRYSGDGNEARYGAAIQAFVTDYSRVISGGSSVTSDSARDEAHALLSKADSPEAVRAVVDQLANKELAVARGASDEAMAAIANPKKYSTLLRLQSRLGIRQLPASDESETAAQQPASAFAGQSTPKAPSNNIDALVSKYLPRQ